MEEKYWDSYYTKLQNSILIPSQFACFVANEYQLSNLTIFEFGCGNGRDTFFFANIGCEIFAYDSSASAINNCNNIKKCFNSEYPVFINKQVSLLTENDLPETYGKAILIYARFFLHAINEEMEDDFLSLISNNKFKNLNLAFEYRTERDSHQEKTTRMHYRRFINSCNLINKILKYGFTVNYFIEGFGYAKHFNDDAHVARILASRSR